MACGSTHTDPIVVGTSVRIRPKIRDVDGDLVDPSEVEIKVERDDVQIVSEVYNGGAGNVTREAVGIYYLDVAAATAGTYEWRVITTNPTATAEGYFAVHASRLTSP